jgi:hypothetical protein
LPSAGATFSRTLAEVRKAESGGREAPKTFFEISLCRNFKRFLQGCFETHAVYFDS